MFGKLEFFLVDFSRSFEILWLVGWGFKKLLLGKENWKFQNQFEIMSFFKMKKFVLRVPEKMKVFCLEVYKYNVYVFLDNAWF